MKWNIILVLIVILHLILIGIQISIWEESQKIYKEILKFLTKKEKQNIDFDRLKEFKKGEYIPLESVISSFSWLELRLAKKEYSNIELCYLLRPYGSTEFKILTLEQFKNIEDEIENTFISPLFKKLD